MTDLPVPDLRNGSLAALRLIETGPGSVYCTACFAQPDHPCRDAGAGHYHRERGWMLHSNIIATLRHHLELPITGPVPEAVEAPNPNDPIQITPYLVIQHYRTDDGRWAWVMRCWGDGDCDGALHLDLDNRPYAERKAQQHLAESHTTPAQEAPRA